MLSALSVGWENDENIREASEQEEKEQNEASKEQYSNRVSLCFAVFLKTYLASERTRRRGKNLFNAAVIQRWEERDPVKEAFESSKILSFLFDRVIQRNLSLSLCLFFCVC